MFRWILRQLHILPKPNRSAEIAYRCKICDRYQEVTLEQQELNDIINGIPFENVFCKARQEELIHLKKGLCILHSREQQ